MHGGMRDHRKIEERVVRVRRKGELSEMRQHVRWVQEAEFIDGPIPIGTEGGKQNEQPDKAGKEKHGLGPLRDHGHR
jgi:hypothetical protein